MVTIITIIITIIVGTSTAFVRGEDEKLTVPDEANWLVNYYVRFRDSNALDLTDVVLEALNKVGMGMCV